MTVTMHPAADRDAWIAAGRAILSRQSSASWEFADWLAVGHAAWGAKAMREAAEATGASAGKISHYLTVSKAYAPLRRRKSLAFSHHMEVARLPDEAADRVLDAAEAQGWSVHETRAAAREASLEGKVARQRREIAELKRALKRAKTDPRDAVKQARSRVDAERRVVRDACGRMADVVEELAADGALDGLHGNARRGVARDIRRAQNALADHVDAALERIEAAAARIDK